MGYSIVIILRQIRHRIIKLCRYICNQEWEFVCKNWNILYRELMKYIADTGKYNEIIQQCRACIVKGNYLRLYDLLAYELDLCIAEQLFHISENDRKELTYNAKRENENVLKTYHREIFDRINNDINMRRIECSYQGTENVCISVKEDNNSFRLFSMVNPWRESSDFVSRFVKKGADEIYVLGFGGGFIVRELEERCPHAMIKVYLPNLDIFKSVIEHIEVSDILQYKNLELRFDSVCLDFFSTVNEKRKEDKNFEFYIDWQELRACIPNNKVTKSLFRKYYWGWKNCGSAEEMKTELAGEKIQNYIKGLVING